MRNKGFTLVELITVIAILGLLAVALIAVVNPVAQLQKANDTRRKSDLAQIQRALELYYQDNNAYPASSANYMVEVNNQTIAWGTTWQPYMAQLPSDPSIANHYIYYSPLSGNGQTYYLYANLERGANDPQACNKGSACPSLIGAPAGFPKANACGGTCNYGVSSANVSP